MKTISDRIMILSSSQDGSVEATLDSSQESEPETMESGNSVENKEKFFKSVEDNDLTTVGNLLLERKINVNIRDQYKDTALHHASKNGYKDMVQLLLDSGASADYDDCDSSPLELAVLYNHTEVVKLLLSVQADPNSYDCFGLTSLHIAAEKGNKEMLQLLLSEGGEPGILSDRAGNSLIHSAAIGIKKGYGGCWNLIEWLLKEYEAQIDPFYANDVKQEPRDILYNYDKSFAEKFDDLLDSLGYYNSEQG